MSPPIRVTIIEDEDEVRNGLTVLIGTSEGYTCVSSFLSMEEALQRLSDNLPDVILIDIGLPGMSGIEGIRTLLARFSRLQLLVLSVYEDDARIFQALCAGACGYLLKTTQPEKILASIREVNEGGAPMSPQVARPLVRLFRQVRPPEASTCNLSPQETRILRLLGDGHHYKTASAELGITINTLSFHMRRIYEKLQVHSKSEAVAKALRDGLIR